MQTGAQIETLLKKGIMRVKNILINFIKCALSVKKEKSIDEILQEEFLRERAAVLGKAADKLTKTLHVLNDIEESIVRFNEELRCLCPEKRTNRTGEADLIELRKTTLKQINQNIKAYNEVREKAKVQYYYLIVTREALGLRKHHWVEEIYAIPPKKKLMKDAS